MDIVRGGGNIFTYSKVGRFIFLGFIHEPALENWRGTKIHATEGLIEPREYVLPRPFASYLNGKAERMGALLRGLSAKQHAKIDEAFRMNVDRFIGSDSFHAFLADMSMFRDKAFSKSSPAEEDAS